MYNDIKLEKGLYNLAGKSFIQVLEERDPDENYDGTPLSNLDAFERQLKRFDIKISGENCDKVEKFFVTTESAVLFPEFVRRAVNAGMEDSILGDIVAVKTIQTAISTEAIRLQTMFRTLQKQPRETLCRKPLLKNPPHLSAC